MKLPTLLLATALLAPVTAFAADGCRDLPSHNALRRALTEARQAKNGGLNLDMWGAIVDRSGVVCAVAYSGANEGSQWPGSRVIAAQKANTANAFSLDASALSTANLYSAVQPGGFLYGLQESNPVDTEVAYDGNATRFGAPNDPMVGERIGGVNVFGGGLALYNKEGRVVGGLGVSGDTSCTDHAVAWRTRHSLALDHVQAGVAADKTDQIIYDIKGAKSAGGFGHPTCVPGDTDIVKTLPAVAAKAEAPAKAKAPAKK